MNPSDSKPDLVKDEHLEYLDSLREGGVVNMFGAAPYLEEVFNVGEAEAKDILLYWMRSFVQRNPD